LEDTEMASTKEPLRAPKPKAAPVRDGRLAVSDNITLVRAARPVVKKDLPPRKDVKGGKKTV
jgi:hypothetical protein